MKPSVDLFRRYNHPLSPLPTGMRPELSGMRDYAAILFDVYGTLLISAAGDIGHCLEPANPTPESVLFDLLQRFGLAQSPADLQQALQRAIAQSHGLSRQLGIEFPEVDIVQIWQQVLALDDPSQAAAFALEYELTVNPVYPMPGLEAVLGHYRRQQVKMGIISNAQFYTPWQLVHFLGSPLDEVGFDPHLLFFSWQWGIAKPSRRMFDKAVTALAGMGIPAESVLYLGNDLRNDILPAKIVGFQAALFAGDRRSLRIRRNDPCCSGISPDLVVTDLRQLIAG